MIRIAYAARDLPCPTMLVSTRYRIVKCLSIRPGILTGYVMAVDEDTVRRIAKLARIRVADAQLKPMAAELNNILKWVEQLDELDISAAEPMTTPVKMKLKMRDDVVTDGGYAKDIVANAPGYEDAFFSVPKVVE